jgi:predicted solute-binding protein
VSDIPADWRIGSVPYLNARPLIYGLESRVRLEVPSQLSTSFAAGELDAALLPVYEAVSRSDATLADDIAIASRGEVYSVFLAHREPLSELPSVALDPASRTSSHLVQCLLAEFHGLKPRYAAAPEDDTQARLIIGDPAIRFHQSSSGWQLLDLGAEWLRCTGLPFVFACWVFRRGFAHSTELASALREVKRRGLAAREQIASLEQDPAFALRYLEDYVRFDLGEDEKRAIALFARLLRKHGLAEAAAAPEIRYV